jgi:hypothetical protein
MDNSTNREIVCRKGRLQMNTPPIVLLEEWKDSPKDYPQTLPYEWWNWHDEYSNAQPSREWSAQVERGIRAGQGRRRS